MQCLGEAAADKATSSKHDDTAGKWAGITDKGRQSGSLVHEQ